MANDAYENKERPYAWALPSGFLMLAATIACCACVLVSLVLWLDTDPGLALGLAGPAAVLFVLGFKGLFTQQPNEARVMIFFGRYVGTCREVGFYWANPFVNKEQMSLRIRNMDIDPIKVNDKVGNPVMIGMVLVWRVADTYRATFDIDVTGSGSNTLERFVRIQADAALREVAGQFAYDEPDGETTATTLRGGSEEINHLLERKINDRLSMAGMEVIEARLNYLAYAPEIAAVMLRRQQASAIISAREKIVEGAVTMVEMALDKIDRDKVAEFDAQARAAMVSNLLVVLCSDEPATPVVSAGS